MEIVLYSATSASSCSISFLKNTIERFFNPRQSVTMGLNLESQIHVESMQIRLGVVGHFLFELADDQESARSFRIDCCFAIVVARNQF